MNRLLRLSLRGKLLLALFVTSLVLAVGLYVLLNHGFERAFLRYVDKMEEAQMERLGRRLGAMYEQYGGWSFLKGNYPLWESINAITFGEVLTGREEAELDSTVPQLYLNVTGGEGVGRRCQLYDGEKNFVVGSQKEIRPALQPLEYNGRVIGWLGLLQAEKLTRRGDRLFAARLQAVFAFVIAVMLGGTLLLTFPVLACLLRPIREITAGTEALTEGEYGIRIRRRSGDELGRLATNFNTLAGTLEKNRLARRQWLADISHELRTPLSVLRGEFEAMLDRVRPLEMEQIERLYDRVLQMDRLVDDLYDLALSDAGRLKITRSRAELSQLLRETLIPCREHCRKSGIELELILPEKIEAEVDSARMKQLFTNLLGNSVFYTDAPGRLEVSLRRDGSRAVIDFDDTPPGVDEKSLPLLFDRLYRVDASRSSGAGKRAGLGLSICRSIVEGHDGNIIAMASPLGGLRIRIELPVAEE